MDQINLARKDTTRQPPKKIMRILSSTSSRRIGTGTQKLVISCNIHPTFHPSSWPYFSVLLRNSKHLKCHWQGITCNLLKTRMTVQFRHFFPDMRPCFTDSILLALQLIIVPHGCVTFNQYHLITWYSVHLVLRILSSTHQLQQLRVSYPVHEDLPSFLPIASLPHLKRLNYRGACEEGAILLNHIKIPLDCWLCMDEPWGCYFTTIRNPHYR